MTHASKPSGEEGKKAALKVETFKGLLGVCEKVVNSVYTTFPRFPLSEPKLALTIFE